MKLAIGCDEAGFYLKEEVKKHLEKAGHEIVDVGVYNTDPAMYPDVAAAVAGKVLDKEVTRGILICGTGIGMAMTANKFHGIRAAVCHDSFSTERSIKSNNAHIMCMGARVIGSELAKQLVDMWISYEYVDGPSTPKIDRMMHYDAKRD